jgi:hypothetical protein
MTFNSKIRLGFLASAVALAFAAPSAFANGDRTARNILTDPGSTSGAPAAIRTEQVKKKSSGVAPDSGRTVRGLHTDPGGTPDAPAAVHTEQVMQKKSGSLAPDSGRTVAGLHTDAGGTPDAPAAIHTEQVMKKKSGRMDTVVPLSKPAY